MNYTVEDGLPQNRVSIIFQDSKGFIWLGTLNGACKFDGYEFTSYLNGFSETYRSRGNRIRRIAEDKEGYIWFVSYTGDVHRLDPRTDSLVNLEKHINDKKRLFNAYRIEIAPSGKVWLISDKSGCVAVENNALKTERYCVANGRLKNNHISWIHEDQDRNTWILTDNGLAMVRTGDTEPVFYFGGNSTTRHVFHSVAEGKDRIWFGSDNGRVWCYSKTEAKFDLLQLPAQSAVGHLTLDKKEQLVMGTKSHGVLILDPKTGKIDSYHTGNSGLLNDQVLSLYPDPWGNTWIQIPVSGIARFDPQDKTIEHHYSGAIPEENNSSTGVVIKMQGEERLWIRPRSDVFSWYDPEQKKLISFNETRFAPYPDYPPYALSFFFDRQNNLWLARENKGVDKITFSRNEFRTGKVSESNNHVRAILEDRDRNLWISIREKKIFVTDSLGTSKGYLCSDGTVGEGVPLTGIAYSMHQDARGDIWLGTRGDGLYRLTPTGAHQGSCYKITHFRNDPRDSYSLNNNNVFSVRSDSKGRIWIGTWGGGLNMLVPEEKGGPARFIHAGNRLANYPVDRNPNIRYISEEKDGKIFAGTAFGLLVFDIDFDRPEEIHFQHYDQYSMAEGSLSNSDVYAVLHASTGSYVATAGGGVSRIAGWDAAGFPASFEAYTSQTGLSSDMALNLLESPDSCIWIVAEKNITRFNPANHTFRSFDEVRHMLGSALFSEGAAILTSSRNVLLGYAEGLFSFPLSGIHDDAYLPPISFTHFRLFNKEIPIGEDSPLEKHINELEKVTLTHKQNFFNIEFAALDFTAPENIHYAYMLDGFDPDWNYSHKQRTANYTNLPKGEYTFRVKSTNAEGTWVDNERTLQIRMLPAFWETGWAYALYGFGLVLLIVGGAYILHTIFKLKNQVRLESQLAEMKLRFFTDISHEIRTPLTLITAPVDHMVNSADTPAKIKEQLALVSMNTERMLRMVNQILDLSKVQAGRLRIEEFPIGEFLAKIGCNFEEVAREQLIGFWFEDQTNGASIWADKDGLEKIMFNLISNAFKYTPSGKNIHVKAMCEEGEFRISVADQGKGIETDNQSLIFERFFMADPGEHKASSGIGLSMVKEWVEKHGGAVRLESRPGLGSTFTVALKKGYDHYGSDVDWIVPSDITKSPETRNEETAFIEETENFDTGDKVPSVLIVEDDNDLRDFLQSVLQADYRVLTAKNGKSGLQTAVKRIPDFIVSDVMMPEMDGIELLKELKTNLNTSHIPVVLLTAKSRIENKLEGLEFGADDYIVKPFSVPYFRARIRNLLQQRKHLQDLYCSDFISAQKYDLLKKKSSRIPDKEFLDQIVQQIESRLDDSHYSIEELVKTTGISRTAFFKKMKALTGMSPIEFVREIRIQNAEKLLKTQQLMVKEVSYMVGFTDLKYFTQCFKAKYGLTPTEYKKQFT